MVVVPIEQRDANRRAGERARSVETTEAAAKDDDMVEAPVVHASLFSVLSFVFSSVPVLRSRSAFSFWFCVLRSELPRAVRCYGNCHGARFFA